MQVTPRSFSFKAQFLLASILLGFSSMTAQIILFREMMVAFYGNELTLGIMLSVWLFWVGLGSALANRITRRKTYSPSRLSLWYFSSAVATLLTVILIRFSKQILGTAPAEIVGFFPMLFFAFAVMSLLCLILGITFVLNSKSWTLDETLVFSVNRVYLWESLGAAFGGLAVTFFLIPVFSNFGIAVILFSLNLLFFATLLTPVARKQTRVAVWVLVMAVIVGLPISKLDQWLDHYSASRMWRELPLIDSEDSRYGNISVTRQQEQITFYQNGLMLFSHPDDFSAEEAVHFALLEHPRPQSLLLIGGGAGGALSEALKYDGLQIDHVEIDPELIRMGKRHLPEVDARSLSDPRVLIHLVDGRLFVKDNAKADKGRRFDVVILNLPDPNTAQLNRLYTAEFFGMIKSVLNDGGVFSFRVSSAENYISRELGLYLSSIYRTLKSAFAEVRILPGSNSVFLASEEKGLLFDDWKILAARLNQRNISTRFVNENFLPDRLSPLRLALLEDAICEKEGRLNSDLKPICYFYNGILWSKQFKSLEKSILLHLSGVHSAWLPGAIILAFSAGFLLCMLGRSKSSNLALAAIFAAGFTSIFVEIIVVLSFQIFHGYIYSMIGLIFTLFMLGLFVGAAAVQRGASRGRVGFKELALVQLLQLVFVFLLLVAVWAFAKSAAPDLVVLAVLLFFVTVSGILGGVLFALANHLFLRRETTRKAGTGYSIDLFGASLCSLLAAAILIPLLGIPASLVMLVLINMICFGSLLTLLRAK